MQTTYSRQSRERRALNTVWTAAGDYGFLPDFLAFHADGSPDLYLNAIIGLTHKYYDAAKLREFTQELDESWFSRTFHDLLWLGIESAAYSRAVDGWQALALLRRQHCIRFLQDNEDVAMQHLMLRNDLTHTLKAARCRAVLGEAPMLYNPWERQLYDALRYPAELTTDDLIKRTRAILRRYFIFRFGAGRKHVPLKLSLSLGLSSLLRRLLPVEEDGTFTPRSRTSNASGTGASAKLTLIPGFTDEQKDAAKVRHMFPDTFISESGQLELEQALCTGPHAASHLYFARCRIDEGQRAANEAWLAAHRAVCRTAIRQLSRRLRATLSVWRQPISLPSRAGNLNASRVWRALYAKDDRVFHAAEAAPHAEFSVVLLLDASYSRVEQQTAIATQAYVIARALSACGIPLAILSYCSLNGYTVLQRMKGFSESDASGIFNYAATGWNRDGFALRAAAAILPEHLPRPLFLVLTDARPSDDRRIPRKGAGLQHDYSGRRAIEDTAAEVRSLKARGIRVIGLIQSEVADAEDAARQIYGHDFARIERIGDLANAVASHIELQIRQG